RPCDARSGSAKQCSSRNDLLAHFQRHVSPVRSPTVQVRAVHEIADAYDRAESVVGETLQVVDQVVASKVFLGHCAVHIVLISDEAVQVDLRRHDGLPAQIDMNGARGNLDFTPATHAHEL